MGETHFARRRESWHCDQATYILSVGTAGAIMFDREAPIRENHNQGGAEDPDGSCLEAVGSVSFRTLGPNLFIVECEKWWDKDRILEGQPWTFDGDLFSLVDYDGLTQMEDMEFEKAAFWVRMYRLPLACMGKEVGLQMGSTVGEVEDIDVLDDGVGWGEYLRVKIRIDLTKPLARGRIIKVQDKEIWVAFQYEKIPRFCFTCGTMVHNRKKCGEYGGRRV
jgi:hypothetical protein